MQAVVETPSYLADAERLFSPEERMAIVDRLAADPRCGVVIPGSGGIREVRFRFWARGKSGGVRGVFFVHRREPSPLFFLLFFQQTENKPLPHRRKTAVQSIHPKT